MSDDYPILKTTHGSIKGAKQCTIYGETYYSFEGIPYAKPPLGELRFRAPQPFDAWTDVLDCLRCAPKPLQKNLFTGALEGSEDCLYLNVYTKKLQSPKPLPVLIYIFGGAFQNGEATRNNLGPDYFMQEDVVLVTLNYRLGPLGFLSLNDASLHIPGNAGLKDQLAALRWFNENCKLFNGDVTNITLFGESAGSASVHYLMLTPHTEGLFHKAILMSGTVYNKWAHIPTSDYAFRLAKLKGYEGDDVDEHVLQFLLNASGGELVGDDIRTEEERWQDISYAFGPIVETYDSADCIIPKPPQDSIKVAWSNNIPVLIGGTSFEGLLSFPRVRAQPHIIEILKSKPELIVPYDVRILKTEEEAKKLGREIIQMYFQGAELSFENYLNYLEVISYKIFWHGFHRSIFSRLIHATVPTYLYRFDFDSPTFNFYRIKYCGPSARGVAHADDLSYLFRNNEAWKLPKDTDEYKTIRRMIGMWTSFARNSDPNCEEIQPAIWQPVDEADPFKCLNISTQVEQMELPEKEKLQFWDDMYRKELFY